MEAIDYHGLPFQVAGTADPIIVRKAGGLCCDVPEVISNLTWH